MEDKEAQEKIAEARLTYIILNWRDNLDNTRMTPQELARALIRVLSEEFGYRKPLDRPEFNNALEADAHNWDTRELDRPEVSQDELLLTEIRELLKAYRDSWVSMRDRALPIKAERIENIKLLDYFQQEILAKVLEHSLDRLELGDEVLIGTLESLYDNLDADRDLAWLKALGCAIVLLKRQPKDKPPPLIDVEEFLLEHRPLRRMRELGYLKDEDIKVMFQAQWDIWNKAIYGGE